MSKRKQSIFSFPESSKAHCDFIHLFRRLPPNRSSSYERTRAFDHFKFPFKCFRNSSSSSLVSTQSGSSNGGDEVLHITSHGPLYYLDGENVIALPVNSRIVKLQMLHWRKWKNIGAVRGGNLQQHRSAHVEFDDDATMETNLRQVDSDIDVWRSSIQTNVTQTDSIEPLLKDSQFRFSVSDSDTIRTRARNSILASSLPSIYSQPPFVECNLTFGLLEESGNLIPVFDFPLRCTEDERNLAIEKYNLLGSL
jgi:hypothetical protein